ncbi:type VI secretion system ImpA family N-terminal domain-containing protein [Vibrio tubiashii]|uniref:type VI secretion system protein TssA n=1 Tax=Vibrio tubiashii TaxID=29498 RepID=UPI001EFD64D9|nr:type VI secretion system ImpA family N-terminal domain-containing protein [Vibrio tubiashii]MCG9583602.1 type VI secretion system ImpA family N-terminal domain-containing protein [Vibrio tubiashii]MCG9617179.1 type VI secretion system ImpA family N-terminal domain-containing protein [Vibrio tubiashii]MCG9685863.1 type VI secretion system ImpA family N-terminal domain-containing protein [Vibrio tubiashii]
MPFLKSQAEQLSQPISDELVCGVYLKMDKSAFRPLRNEFNVAQTALRKLSQNPAESEKDELIAACHASWQSLSERLLETFAHTTRDIELISWFIAAQCLLDPSLESAANSIEWLADLAEQHWDHLNPVLTEEKLISDESAAIAKQQAEGKIKALMQLVGESEESCLLYGPLLQLPLVGTVTFYDYQSAERRGETSQLKSSLSAVVAQERAAITAKLDNLSQALAQLDRLRVNVAQRSQALGVKAANFGFVTGLLRRVDQALFHLTGIKVTAPTEPKAAAPAEEPSVVSESTIIEPSTCTSEPLQPETTSQHLHAGNLSAVGALNNMNRDLAFHLLREIADYFRQSEPHSPSAFMLEKVIRWGYLPLPELLQEMMAEKSADSVSAMFNAVGLNHLEQVTLPEVTRPAITPVPSVAPQVSESPSAQELVSQTSPVDTQPQRDDEPKSSAKSGLSW